MTKTYMKLGVSQLKYIDIFNDYIETDYDDEFVHKECKLVRDFSEIKNKVFNVRIDYKEPQADYKTIIENISKIYESKYYLFLESYYYYLIDKNKLKGYVIIEPDISYLIYKGNKAQKN